MQYQERLFPCYPQVGHGLPGSASHYSGSRLILTYAVVGASFSPLLSSFHTFSIPFLYLFGIVFTQNGELRAHVTPCIIMQFERKQVLGERFCL